MAVGAAAVLFSLAFIAASSLLYLILRRAPARSLGLPLPPSPRGLPVLGHLHLLGALPHRALRALAVARGPVMLLWFGRIPTVVVSSAAAAEEVMRARDLEFASRPHSSMADRLLYGARDLAFAPYGEYWRQARRICMVHLLAPRRVLSFRRVREEEAAALVAHVRASAGGADLSGTLVAYANAVISRAAFGDESARNLYGDEARELRKAFADFTELIGTVPAGELVPCLGWLDIVTGLEGKIKRTFKALDAVLDTVIDDHRQRRRTGQYVDDVDSHSDRDFVDVLLDVHETDHDKEASAGIRLEIKAIILDMFAAGTGTTSAAIEWAMAELVTHPSTMRKLQDEIRAAFGVERVVTEERLDELRYLKAVIKETLRLHTPIIPREPPGDTEILGYHIPAGTRVLINGWAIGRDPATWGESAEEFVPERFLQDSAALDFRGQNFGLIPFGAGRRGCPAIGFAVPTMELAVASLLYHFDWEAAGGGSSLDMTETNGLSVVLKSGLPLVAKPWFP